MVVTAKFRYLAESQEMMDRIRTQWGSKAASSLLALAFSLLLLGAGVIGAAHHHHAAGAGAGDASCAVCQASTTAAAITVSAAVPASPTQYSEALAPVADRGPTSAAPRRASSRAPPTV